MTAFSLEQLRILNEAITSAPDVEKGRIEAANAILAIRGIDVTINRHEDALTVLRQLEEELMECGDYRYVLTLLLGQHIFNSEPFVVREVFRGLHSPNHKLLLQGAGSVSKCLGPDVPVLMFDGSTKKAKDVRVGDQLMGDDSKPRNVLKANAGYGKLYRITPERGESWICNSDHILSLRCALDRKCGSGHLSNKWRKNTVHDIPIEDYLKSSATMKRMLFQFSVGADFPEQPVEYDPYCYGAWLADGGVGIPVVHKPEGPMTRRWCEYFSSIGFRVVHTQQKDRCSAWFVRANDESGGGAKPNPFTDFVRRSHIGGEKRILKHYLVNSRENRLKLLAGLIDGDATKLKSGFVITTKYDGLRDDIIYLARSLGFSSWSRRYKGVIKSLGFEGWYNHVYISSNNIDEIPTLQKKVVNPTTNKNLTNTGFKVEEIGNGEYFGFVIDGNHRFLMGDFTVTHNTYSASAWHYADWRRWPQGTFVKVAAVSEDHLRRNVFAGILKMHAAAEMVIPMQSKVKIADLYLGVEEAGEAMGFSGVAFSRGNVSTGRFRGYKSQPTHFKHKTLGSYTRLRVLGDEANSWDEGPFKDFGSTLASMTEDGRVKITLCYNPDMTSRPVVVRAEPEHGWIDDDIDTLYEWDSKQGWHVIRLDAAKTENVINKRQIYEGLQSYKGYMDILKAAGDNGADYYCFCRGFPPVKGASNAVIPPAWVTECRGEATFLPGVETLVTTDMAYAGIDKPTMCVWRWGKAIGWRRQDGQFVHFRDRQTLKEKPRFVLQLDQIIYLEKADQTIMAAEEIQGRCNDLGVSPENVAIDSTGAGLGTASHLRMYWGDVLAVNWGEGATDGKILAEDLRGADEQYDGLISEMWFTVRRWMDPTVGVLLINPIVPSHPINTQLTTRRYKWAKEGRQRVEKKDEWKARHQGLSPDEADSFVMGPLLVRLRKPVLPGLVEQIGPDESIMDDGELLKAEPVDIRQSLVGIGGGEQALQHSQ